jgi:hypothetical protein
VDDVVHDFTNNAVVHGFLRAQADKVIFEGVQYTGEVGVFKDQIRKKRLSLLVWLGWEGIRLVVLGRWPFNCQ